MRLMLDLDGVLVDFELGFLQEAQKIWPERNFRLEDIVDWDFVKGCKNFPIYSSKEFDLVMDMLDWGELKRTKDFDKYISIANQAEYVRIVTSRFLHLEKVTLNWLNENGVKFDDLVFSRGYNKWKYCRDLTHAIDDNDENIFWIKKMNPQIVIIPVPRKWNSQKLDVEEENFCSKLSLTI